MTLHTIHLGGDAEFLDRRMRTRRGKLAVFPVIHQFNQMEGDTRGNPCASVLSFCTGDRKIGCFHPFADGNMAERRFGCGPDDLCSDLGSFGHENRHGSPGIPFKDILTYLMPLGIAGYSRTDDKVGDNGRSGVGTAGHAPACHASL